MFTGCGVNPVSDIIGGADKVKLFLFRGDSLIPVLEDTVGIKDKLIAAIENNESEAYKCGYTGRIEYYKGDSLLLSGDYHLDSCSHIAYMHQGNSYFRKLSAGGIEALDKYRLPRVADMSWLAGTWVAEQEGERPVYEEWSGPLSSDIMYGKSYVILAGDTTINETLSIKTENDGVFYVATVQSQNNGRPIAFELLPQSNKDEYVFSNPLHDFPQRIVYRKINADSLVAIVSGGDAQFEVGMKRIK